MLCISTSFRELRMEDFFWGFYSVPNFKLIWSPYFLIMLSILIFSHSGTPELFEILFWPFSDFFLLYYLLTSWRLRHSHFPLFLRFRRSGFGAQDQLGQQCYPHWLMPAVALAPPISSKLNFSLQFQLLDGCTFK